MLALGLGLGLTMIAPPPPSGGGDSDIAAPFDAVNGPTGGPSAGPYEGWSVTSSAPIADDFAFTVARQGFSGTGGAMSYSDTFRVTRQVRRPYPNQASLEPATWALSDYLYSTDTPAGSAVNNSTLASPKPIANWVTPHRSVVGNAIGGTVVPVEIVAAHRNARGGREVAAVVFSVTDGVNTVTASPVSATVISGRAGDRAPVIVYRMPETDISALNAGLLTIRCKVYPWIGGATSVRDSADGTAVNGRDFGPRYFYKNTSLAGAPYYAYVKAGGSAGGVFSTNPSTAEATPFDSLANMFTALNSGAAGRADGVIVRLGADGGTPWPLVGAASARNQDCAAITITRDPAVARANARMSFGAVSARLRLMTGLDSPLTTGCIRFADLAIVRTGTGSIQGEATNQLEIQFDDVALDNGGHNATWLSQSHDYVYGMAVSGMNVSSPLNAGTFEHRCLRGVSWTSSATSSLERFLVMGCDIAGPINLSAGTRSDSGGMVAFSRFSDPMSSTVFLQLAQASDVDGFAILQNVMEYTAGGTVSALLRVSGDAATGNSKHVVIHANTSIGAFEAGRWNVFYDEGPTPRSNALMSVIGNLAPAIYTKSDLFTTDGTRLGNWAFSYGVGCFDNWSQYASIDPVGGTQAQAYPGVGT
ncbi:hypothetical protein, partial [Phenylobacterium sp.]|uniref:hypothetical protein n=1 Tax=Phenylobacterium sp. TaxID=1871053 RepID=UPI0035AE05BF